MSRHRRDFRFGWLGRKQAAAELEVSEKTLQEWARTGKIATIQKGKRRRLYYVGNSPQVQAYSALPITSYRANGTFVAWIAFTPHALHDHADAIAEWCQHLESSIRNYIESKISPITIDERFAVRKERLTDIEERTQKYISVMRIVSPARTVRVKMRGSKDLV